MINKVYEKVLEFIKENYLWLIFYFVFTAGMLYPLPYYIYTGGGIININDKIELEREYASKGSYNMCYVSEIHVTIPTFLLSYVIPSWDLVSKKEVAINQKETREDILKRDQIYLLDANQSAILTAFSHHEDSSSNYQILDTKYYIVYIEENSNTNLKIGDQIVSIDNMLFHGIDDINKVLSSKRTGDKVEMEVIHNQKKYKRYAIVKEENQQKKLGISLMPIYNYETNPNITFHFTNRESGPSGGLMLSLAIYDKLEKQDITKGLKIAGTGTIDMNGKVGSIGGVKYKLKGAVKAKSDIFIVPNGENYEECIQLQEKYHYPIKIIGVNTFSEAIRKLNKQ